MKIKNRVLTEISVLYLYMPIVLFIFTWVNIWIAIICSLLWVYCVCRIYKRVRKTDNDEYININWIVFILICLFIIIIGYFAGWGRWCEQAGDWQKHNAVLADLVNKKWPVYYHNKSESSMLVYYIACYLIPAVIGKIFNSFRVAEIMLYIWIEIGLILVCLNVIRYLKAHNKFKQLITVFLVCFFQTPLWLSERVLKYIVGLSPVEDGHWFFIKEGILLQYTGNFILFRWVVPQVVAIWLIVVLFLNYKDKIEYYIPLMLPGSIYGTLGFLGIVPIAIGYAVENFLKNKNIKVWIKKIFSVENIIFLITEGTVLILYFYGNVMADKPRDIGFSLMPYRLDNFGIYVVFVSVNILIYTIILWRYKKTDGIFIMIILELLILPMFKMGLWNDLTSRTSIPALFILMIYLIEYIFNLLNEKINKSFRKSIANIVVVCIIFSGTYYPLKDFASVFLNENYKILGAYPKWKTLEVYANRNIEVSDDVKYNYYAYNVENNLFCRFIARTK